MYKEIKMPAGGQTTDVSTIGTWLVKKGDQVKRGDVLLEIETDKATLSVECFTKGTVLACLVEEGEEVAAGTVIAYVGDAADQSEVDALIGGESSKDNAPQAQKEAKAEDGPEEDEYQPIDKKAPVRYVNENRAAAPETQESSKPAVPESVRAMPNAKKLAKENQVSLVDVAAFVGKDTLKKSDVQNYLDNGRKAKAEEMVEQSDDIVIPLTRMRKAIAKNMMISATTIPSFQVSVEADMSKCITVRKLVNDGNENVKISYNDILFKCMEAASRRYPNVNASFTDEAIIVHKKVNIGLAVSIDQGLVVPVCKDVAGKTVTEISAVNKENVAKARAGKLELSEMSGGTITLSNLGMYPVTQFNAMINPPEVCILALSAMIDKPTYVNGEWKAVPTMTITGTFDHRVVDGAYAAQFLTELKKIIETPVLALV